MERETIKEIRTAIKQGDIASVITLIGTDRSRLEVVTQFGTWAHVAARHGQLEILERLLDMGADINACGGVSGGNALNEAAVAGHVEVVEYLLKRGAEMDVSISECNPLFSAIYGGYVEVAKLLVDHGIDTKVVYSGASMHNMDALAFAREWGRDDIVNLLTRRKDSE